MTEFSPESAASVSPPKAPIGEGTESAPSGVASTPFTRPLFRVDPGWPFVLAGIALLVAGILIPAQRELHELRGQQALVEAHEARVYARLESYDRFLLELRANEPDLIRRLAIAHLNMVPKGEQSLLLTPGLDQTVAQWIDESVPPVSLQPVAYPDTLLGRLAVGPNRLWLLAASVFLLFVGMLLGPDTARPMPAAARRDGRPDEEANDDVASPGGGAATAVVGEDVDESPSNDMGGRLASLHAPPIVDADVIDVEFVETGSSDDADASEVDATASDEVAEEPAERATDEPSPEDRDGDATPRG